MNRLDGQVAIITGAGSGIGRATALLFASEGAKVVHCDLNREAGAETQALLRERGAETIGLDADVAGEETAPRLVKIAVELFGKLTTLVNNAGTGTNALVADLPLSEWDRIHNVNVRAQFMLIKAALPEMIRAGGGSIINVASVMADVTDYGLAAYCSSKAGVAGLTRTVALEYGKYGIRANYIMPRPIYTGMYQDQFRPRRYPRGLGKENRAPAPRSAGGHGARRVVPGLRRRRICDGRGNQGGRRTDAPLLVSGCKNGLKVRL